MIRKLRFVPGIDGREGYANIDGISLTGNYYVMITMLALCVLTGMINPGQIVAIGFRKDGKQLHVVLLDKAPEKLLTDGEPTIDKASAEELFLDNYHYAAYLATMKDGLNVGAFDEDFKVSAQIGKVWGRLMSALFHGNKLIGAISDQSSTLLLLNRTSTRVLVASRYGYKHPLTVVDQKIGTDQRYSVDIDSITVARYGTGHIASLQARDLNEMFDTSVVPTWQTQLIAGAQIEEISCKVGETPTVVVTGKFEGKRQFRFANLRWQGEGDERTFKLSFVDGRDIEISDDVAPIARLNADTNFAAQVDSNGSELPRLTIAPIGKLDEHVPGIAAATRDAGAGKFWSAAA